MTQVAKQIRFLRSCCRSEFFMRQCLFNLVENNPNWSLSFWCSLSAINTNTANCENIIHRSLALNFDLMSLLSNCYGVSNLVPESRYVSMSNQPNVFLLAPANFTNVDLCDISNSQFIKQGTTAWHNAQKCVRVTGSTLCKAIGLDTLSAQKVHHSVYIQKKDPPSVTPEVQKMMEYGSKNEVNGLATLVGSLISALLPPCHSYFEVWTIVMDSPSWKNFIAVSPDGYVQCTHGNQQCKYNLACNHKHIAVEVKCPYPNNAIPEEPYYMVPKRHVPQLLAEMAALKVDELWLICYTRKSVSLIIVCHNEMLWNKILNIADDLYGPEKPNAPTRLHPVISQVKMEISEFIVTLCICYGGSPTDWEPRNST